MTTRQRKKNCKTTRNDDTAINEMIIGRQHEKMTTIIGISDNIYKAYKTMHYNKSKKIGSTTKLQYYARIPTLNNSI